MTDEKNYSKDLKKHSDPSSYRSIACQTDHYIENISDYIKFNELLKDSKNSAPKIKVALNYNYMNDIMSNSDGSADISAHSLPTKFDSINSISIESNIGGSLQTDKNYSVKNIKTSVKKSSYYELKNKNKNIIAIDRSHRKIPQDLFATELKGQSILSILKESHEKSIINNQVKKEISIIFKDNIDKESSFPNNDESGIVSPSSSVSMSPRLQALAGSDAFDDNSF